MEICLDEIACYAQGLTAADFQAHLAAAGWGQRVTDTGKIVARVEAARNAQRAAKAKAILSDPALTDPGKTRAQLKVKDGNVHLKLPQAITLKSDRRLEIELS